MLESAPCPACRASEWETLRSQEFLRPDETTDRYVKPRLTIVFDRWFKTGDEKVTIAWKLCRSCGFVCYFPRPTSEDIGEKYALLSKGGELGSPDAREAIAYLPTEWRRHDPLGHHRARGLDLFHTLRSVIPERADILDFGGARGVLLEDFVTRGHKCTVVDYGVRDPLPGVAYAGPDLAALPPGRHFDLIICSHVFEHVAEPMREAAELLKYLKPSGVLYIEVPCEIWRSQPRPREIATHVNYFSVPSLRAMLAAAGAASIECYYAPFHTYRGDRALSVRSLSSVAMQRQEAPTGGSDSARALMAGDLKAILGDWMPGRFDERVVH